MACGRGCVVHIIDHLQQGGAQTLLADILPHLPQVGYRAAVVALRAGDGPRERLQRRGVPVVELRGSTVTLPWKLSAAPAIVARWRPVLLHAHLEVSTAAARYLAGRLGVPYVVHLHNFKLADAPGYAALFRWGVARAAAVVAVSRHAATVARSLGVPASVPVVVAHNAVDVPSLQAAEPHDLKGELGLPPDMPVAIAVGRLAEQKGLDVLLRAWAAVVAQIPTHLVIVGEGPLRRRLERLAARLAVDRWVHFLGVRWDVPSLLKACDLLVLASRWEGLSIVLLEASAAGLPAVATQVGGNDEIIVAGETGLLVPPEDASGLAQAVLELLSDPERARRMGRAAQRRARELFDAPAAARRWAAVYDRVLSPPGEPPAAGSGAE